MMQKTQNNKRPSRGPNGSGQRERKAAGGDKIRLSADDKIFLAELYDQLCEFVESDKDKFEVEPCNSYKRKLVHDLSLKFNLHSVSEGAGDERHNVLTKTDKTSSPALDYKKKPLWNFSREFILRKSPEGVDIVLNDDGSVSLYVNQPEDKILDRKKVTTGSFKIISGKIIEFNQPEWK